MACVEYSLTYKKACLVLQEGEVRNILPLIEGAINRERKLFDKFKDIHDSGEATEQEEDLLIRHELKLEYLSGLRSEIERFLK